MQSLFRLADVPSALRGAVVALGNFDGVHRGHGSVLQLAADLGGPLVVLTFEPHPRALLVPGSAPFRLTPGSAKLDALSGLGVDACLTLAFDRALAATPPETFVHDVLVQGLGARHVVVGHDYAFGKGRAGDIRLLREMGLSHGFGVVATPPKADCSGERISSSQIRAHLQAGRVLEASRLLGRAWTISGVLQVQGRGVAALALGDHLRPGAATYEVELLAGSGARLSASADWSPAAQDRLTIRAASIEHMDGLKVDIAFIDQAPATQRSEAYSRHQISCG
jgi:riboflavin kinase/FMN adenylyltransferase